MCLSSLDSLLLTFHEEYEELAYRKLIIGNGNALQIEDLESYINNIIGSKYELSLSKLLLNNDTELSEERKEGELPN